MVKMPDWLPETDPTLDAADRALEEVEAGKPRRNYLGMSALGDACERKLWIGYNNYYPPERQRR